MPGDVHRGVGRQGPGEDPHDADPPDVLVAARPHHLGHQRRRPGHRSPCPALAAAGREGLLRRGARAEPGSRGRTGRAARCSRGRRWRRPRAPGAAWPRPPPSPGPDQQLLVDLLAAEVALHQRLVLGLLDHGLDQRRRGARRRRRRRAGRSPRRRRVRRPAAPARRTPPGPPRNGAVEVGPRVVELGHHHRARHVDRGALTPQLAGALVDGLVGGHHEQRAVGGPEPGPHLTDEVGVARGVEQVDLAARRAPPARRPASSTARARVRRPRSRTRCCARRPTPARLTAPEASSSASTSVVLPDWLGPDQDDVAHLLGRGHLEMVAGDPAAAALHHGIQPTPIPARGTRPCERSDRVSGRSARSAGSPSATARRHPTPSRSRRTRARPGRRGSIIPGRTQPRSRYDDASSGSTTSPLT